MSQILISGSLAYDHLYSFPGVFQKTFLRESDAEISVAFNVTNKAVHFGGCGGNIVFNAKLFKEHFFLLGIAGKDFDEYERWLKKHRITPQYVIRVPHKYTSQATVVTDQKGQQITFFHEGAASSAQKYRRRIKKVIRDLAPHISLAMISPNSRDFITASLEGCRENKIPFFFDPGQAMPLFTPQELSKIASEAYGMIFNEYEFEAFQKRLKVSGREVHKLCKLLIITQGERGSEIFFEGHHIHILAGKPRSVKDPTGCGDAYRAGFLIGIKDSFPKLTKEILKKAGALGTKLATACLEVVGTQNHRLSSPTIHTSIPTSIA